MNKSLLFLLVALKNAALYKKTCVSITYLSQYNVILNLLYEKGYIQSFYIYTKNHKKVCNIYLREYFNKCILSNIILCSTPAFERRILYSQLLFLRKNISKLLVINTNKGLLSYDDCLKKKVGGILLFIL